MALTPFAFDPTDGLRNTSTYPTTPDNETDARDQIQTPLDELKDGLNTVINAVDTDATLTADSDDKIPSQKAVKSFVENKRANGRTVYNGVVATTGTTISIPLGISAKQGSFIARSTTSNKGVFVNFSDDINYASSISTISEIDNSLAMGVYAYVSDSRLSYYLSSSTPQVYIKSAKINGTNLEIVVDTDNVSNQTIYLYISWEAIG
jgi:hypothetical protein